MRLTRDPSWEKKLDLYIQRYSTKTYEWGKNDCVTFTTGWVRECCDVDLKGYIGEYSSEQEAKRLLGSIGYRTVSDAFNKNFGGCNNNPLKAKRGDIVQGNVAMKGAVGIVDNTGRYAVFISEPGTIRKPLIECKRFWRVG